MPFLTNDPLPQCLQHNSATGGLLGRDHARGCRRYLLKVKCLRGGTVRHPPSEGSDPVGGSPLVSRVDPGRGRRPPAPPPPPRQRLGRALAVAPSLGEPA